MPKIAHGITTEWRRFDQLSAEALYEMLRFRQQIFVVEQRSPYLDLDGFDQSAHHLLLRIEGTISGYLRLMPPADRGAVVRIGRVAIAAGLRRQGLGRRLMTEALSFCRERYSGHAIGLSAQCYLVGFYHSFGFIEFGAPFDDGGIPHIEMRRD
ncbi:MAG: GNAT family N-acetyltransferase [Alphaproteobacteria bacterium]|nr:GNAT family N-acetyltransferase [Alphaproteobacteria bacterium]